MTAEQAAPASPSVSVPSTPKRFDRSHVAEPAKVAAMAPVSTAHFMVKPKRRSIWRVLLYLLSFAMFIKISIAMIAFHPPRPDRPESVFGGRFVFLTVQTNFILTIYNALCVMDSLLTDDSKVYKMIVSRLMHITSGAAFAVGSIMGLGYYGLVHFNANTRLRAAAIQDFDFYMHLLHGVPLLFVFMDILFKDRTFIQAAPQQIRTLLMSRMAGGALSPIGSCSSLNSLDTNTEQRQPMTEKELVEELKREQALARRKRGLRRMTRAMKQIPRNWLLRLLQGDMILSVVYGVFYVAWTVLCSTLNNWWPYPFQASLSPMQHAALYSMLVGVLLPVMTLLSRVLRGRATQIAVILAGRVYHWGRNRIRLRKQKDTVAVLMSSVNDLIPLCPAVEPSVAGVKPIPARTVAVAY